jgi:hypothetical protein
VRVVGPQIEIPKTVRYISRRSDLALQSKQKKSNRLINEKLIVIVEILARCSEKRTMELSEGQ